MGASSSKAISAQQQAVEGASYVEPTTGQSHTFSVGENVLLTGAAAQTAAQNGYLPLGKIASASGPGQVVIQFYTRGPVTGEGMIGAPVAQAAFPVQGSVTPLPMYTKSVPYETLVQNATRFTCQDTNLDEPWGCTSCSPSGTLFSQREFFQTRDQVMGELTEVKGGPGSVRYTMFTCPSQISLPGAPISPSNQQCKPVIISTIANSDGSNTNRYSLISLPTKYVLQAAVLYSYGLPLDPEYFNAVPWSQFPDYQRLLSTEGNQKIVCADVDNTWLYQKVEELLKRGYKSSEVNLID